MASIRRYKDKWRAFVRRKGISKTAVFPTKREAQDWAARTELLIIAEADGKVKRPFREYIIRYRDEVTPTKRITKWDESFFSRLLQHPIADIIEPKESDFAAYRDERMKQVQGVTVRKELLLMSAIFTVAIKEWHWTEKNPVTDIKKPKINPPRDRRITDKEIEILKKAVKYSLSLDTVEKRVIHAFLFAIETAMRIGEIASLTWENINFEKRTAQLPITKNGDPRKVPLSPDAIELLIQLPRVSEECFRIKGASRYFCDICKRAGIKNLHLHDSRHEAITRLAKKVDALALARIVGHKRVNQLMTYYNESAEDIALKL